MVNPVDGNIQLAGALQSDRELARVFLIRSQAFLSVRVFLLTEWFGSNITNSRQVRPATHDATT